MKKNESLELAFARLKATLARIEKARAGEPVADAKKKRGITIEDFTSVVRSVYMTLNYGKTRKIRAMAKKRGISVEAMCIELASLGLKIKAEKEQSRKRRSGGSLK